MYLGCAVPGITKGKGIEGKKCNVPLFVTEDKYTNPSVHNSHKCVDTCLPYERNVIVEWFLIISYG